jgi:hypothetical protein
MALRVRGTHAEINDQYEIALRHAERDNARLRAELVTMRDERDAAVEQIPEPLSPVERLAAQTVAMQRADAERLAAALAQRGQRMMTADEVVAYVHAGGQRAKAGSVPVDFHLTDGAWLHWDDPAYQGPPQASASS